ncbi:hypothetical protein [Nocardia nova]|uniref:hypothetical protein n=1 Tax=Nocardia nova TaxID=37330 RepID=UPI0033F42E6B
MLRIRSCDLPGAAAVGGIPMIGDISCPGCGYDDLVQSVPAIRASGVATVHGTSYHSGVGVGPAGLVPVLGTSVTERTESSFLAQVLAPEPHFRGAGRLVAWGVVAGIPAAVYVLLGIIELALPHPEVSTSTAILGTVVLALFVGSPSLLILWFAFRRAHRTSRIRRGAPRAYAVWRAGFYCHRCGVCFWPLPTEEGIPVRVPLMPGQFQWIVWSAGNYARLA